MSGGGLPINIRIDVADGFFFEAAKKLRIEGSFFHVRGTESLHTALGVVFGAH